MAIAPTTSAHTVRSQVALKEILASYMYNDLEGLERGRLGLGTPCTFKFTSIGCWHDAYDACGVARAQDSCGKPNFSSKLNTRTIRLCTLSPQTSPHLGAENKLSIDRNESLDSDFICLLAGMSSLFSPSA